MVSPKEKRKDRERVERKRKEGSVLWMNTDHKEIGLLPSLYAALVLQIHKRSPTDKNIISKFIFFFFIIIICTCKYVGLYIPLDLQNLIQYL